MPNLKGSQVNGSVLLQNEKKKEINQNEPEKGSEDGKVRPWKLRLNETKNSKREDYVSFYKTIKENQDKENKGEDQEKKEGLQSTSQSSPSERKQPSCSDSFVYYYLALSHKMRQ